MSHLTFGMRWKKKFPDRPWKPFLKARPRAASRTSRFQPWSSSCLPADKIADVRSLLQHRFTHGASVARFLEDTSNRVRVETAWVGSDGQARPRQVTTFRVAPEDAPGVDRTDGADEDKDGAARREQRLLQRSSRGAVNHQVAGTGWVMVLPPPPLVLRGHAASLTSY
jgi:hypothetical protein